MTLDTNILIAYINGEKSIIDTLSFWRQSNKSLFLSTVVEAEVLSFIDMTINERLLTQEFLEANFTSVSFDRNVARIAANIRKNTKIKFPDAAIAATALFTHTPLVTRNQKDFKKIPGLEIVSI